MRAVASGMVELRSDQAERLCRLLEEETGLVLSSRAPVELAFKLRALLERDGPDALLMRTATDAAYRQQVVNALTIGESYFFRNHPHFNALTDKIIPEAIERNAVTRRLRIWSAGCATGEEPYSVMMLLASRFEELAGWNVDVWATDINTEFLDRAQKAVYGSWSFRGVPADIKKRFFTQREDGTFALDRRIADAVRFSPFNLASLADGPLVSEQPFDIILCRNVLIYFPSELAWRICASFSQMLCNRGYLLLGHSESFSELPGMETVYSHGTYYYRRADRESAATAPHSFSLIPGLATYDPDKLLWTDGAASRSHDDGSSVPAGDDVGEAGDAAGARVPGGLIPAPAREEKGGEGGPDAADAPSSPDAQMERAWDMAMAGDLDGCSALIDALEATLQRPDFRIFFLRALVADQRNQVNQALIELRRALFVAKDFVIGHYYLGAVAERCGDLALARRSYRNVCRLAARCAPSQELPFSGGTTAERLGEIAQERLKEVSLEEEQDDDRR